jgi:hypothetical protein
LCQTRLELHALPGLEADVTLSDLDSSDSAELILLAVASRELLLYASRLQFDNSTVDSLISVVGCF